jgi:hypothetical protein
MAFDGLPRGASTPGMWEPIVWATMVTSLSVDVLGSTTGASHEELRL